MTNGMDVEIADKIFKLNYKEIWHGIDHEAWEREAKWKDRNNVRFEGCRSLLDILKQTKIGLILKE